MIQKITLLNLIGIFSTAALSCAADSDAKLPEVDHVPMLSFEESLKTFQLPEGYHLELVVGDPVIKEPVVCAFDGNGRMFVAEMRTYMQNADATGEQEPTSCVSLHEDTNGDGKMDKHSIFIDDLLLPRQILPLDDRLLVQETNTLDIFSYRDTDGDGVADEKELFFEGGERGGNMEHQPSGLIWSMDNWLYTTYSAYRLRYNGNGLTLKEPTAPNGGQWGLTQDNHGKPWYVNAGGEMGPLNFQQPIVYGQFNVSDQFAVGYREVFPLVAIPDVQGGEKRFRPEEKTLNHFTATCGEEVFRGDRLPEDIRGDLLFSEPVGRLIRRSKVDVKEGVTYLKNAYDKDEFIRSTDPNFRAVNMVTAPDGCLYIVDMYRGIIQQGNWTKPGSYLRGVIDQYGFGKNVGRGRIYRVVHDDFERGPQPNMLDESPAELVAHLEHPNGWWRDTAQKLLILKGYSSITPALVEMVDSSEHYLAKMHALWTLEGLGAATPEIIHAAAKDSHPQVRRAAIRVSETLLKAGDESLAPMVRFLAGDADADVAVQAMMTAKLLKWKDHKELIQSTMASNQTLGVQAFGKQMLTGGQAMPKKLTNEQITQYNKGKATYGALCFACHGADGKGMALPGTEMTLAPSLADSSIISGNRELAVKVVLHGLTGPIEGKTYPGEMISMESNGDAWIAEVLSYLRNSFGNSLGFISAGEVADVRKANQSRKTPWNHEELMASVPQSLPDKQNWKLSSSHGSKDLDGCVDGDLTTRWTTGKSMSNGMWIQVELPEPALVSGVTLNAGTSRSDYPRGYSIELSEDGVNWKSKVKKGEGKTAITQIEFEEDAAKFVKITQTGEHRLYWSIHDLEVLGKTK